MVENSGTKVLPEMALLEHNVVQQNHIILAYMFAGLLIFKCVTYLSYRFF